MLMVFKDEDKFREVLNYLQDNQYEFQAYNFGELKQIYVYEWRSVK